MDFTKLFGVYRQRAQDAALWASRGCNLALSYEPQEITPGHPSVTQSQWRAAWKAAGCTYICEPADPTNLVPENSDAGLTGILYPTQELDNYVVTAHDNNLTNGKETPATLAAVEKVYTDLEAFCAKAKREAPSKPVWILLALEQLTWHKADYARLLKSCDYCCIDWYAIHRGSTPAVYAGLIDQLVSYGGKDKVKLGINECSLQRLNPLYYPAQRLITVTEFRAENQNEHDRGMGTCLFPQQMGEDGSGFKWDAMPAELLAEWKAFTGATTTPPIVVTPPTTAPAGVTITLPSGEVITLPAGKSYRLTAN